MSRHRKPLSRQEIFDIVWDRFITRRHRPGIDPTGIQCMYRGPRNTRCALGGFIPDDVYTKDLEGEGVKKIIPLCPDLSMDDAEFLFALQDAHDSASLSAQTRSFPERFTFRIRRELLLVADTFGLSHP